MQLFIGALLVYDVTDEDSFQRATNWYKELIHEIGRDAPIILAGNKCDIMNHTVSKEDADQFARSKGIEHVQASALSGNNVEYIFTTLAESKFRLHYFPNYIFIHYLTRNDGEKSLKGATTWARSGWPPN